MNGPLETNRSVRPGARGSSHPEARERGTGLRTCGCLTACLISVFLCLSTAYASGGGGEEAPNWMGFFWRLLNFAILLGVLYWLLAGKMRDFFTGRREGIKTALAEAVSAREAAEKKFRETSEKLDKATEEIEQLGEMIREQGLAEKERIIRDARKEAEKIMEDARTRMEQEFSKASRNLRTEAANLSTQMAEDLLRRQIRPEDHEALVKDYIGKVTNKA